MRRRPLASCLVLALSLSVAGSAAAATGKPCLFLHGLGIKGAGAFSAKQPPSWPRFGSASYWGNMETELRGVCSSFEYASFDTTKVGWDDAALQSAYYNRAREIFAGGGVVFAHGSANLVLAGACRLKGQCEARWISLGGPIRGTRAADAPRAVRALGGAAGPLSSSLSPKHPTLAALGKEGATDAVQTKGLVKAAACGTDGWGSGGVAGVALKRAQRAAYGRVPCKPGEASCTGRQKWVEADGVVGVDECAGALAQPFSSASNASFFLYRGNHYDLTGNGGHRQGGNHKGFYDWLRTVAGQK